DAGRQPQHPGRPARPEGVQGAQGRVQDLRPHPRSGLSQVGPRGALPHHRGSPVRAPDDRGRGLRGARMYAIVIGGGKVGYFLSPALLDRGDEVTLVEKDAARAEWLESQLGSIVMRGDGDEMAFLSTTGIERADAVLAVTGDDEDNLVALQLAKKAFNVP